MKSGAKSIRIEQDALGTIAVPADKLWGAQTERAVKNFPISGLRFGRDFIAALGAVKRACALANLELEGLQAELGPPIIQACREVQVGKLDDHFPVDIFQTGSGTSTNMNANEVIANRANQLLGHQLGSKSPVHPNDHVNMSQSSNDLFPTVIHVASTLALRDKLIPVLSTFRAALIQKAESFDHIVKIGRTHLQDAVPIRLGQEFGGYAAQVLRNIELTEEAIRSLRPLPLGGTAVGTGLNCPPNFPIRAISHLNALLETDFSEAENHIAANAARDELVALSGTLKTIAVTVSKIANDIRWLSSGPRNGLGELTLPAVQPGSSIMPGKINPVLAEALLMVAAQIIGYDSAITISGLGGVLELNTMMPLMAHNLLDGIEILTNAIRAFTAGTVEGIEANKERCQIYAERTLALVTALVPTLGYDAATRIAQEAERSGRTIREVAAERSGLSAAELEALLSPYAMTEPERVEASSD